eukprot:Hpha_TRINITY_DN13555_c0_g2::TRINITY_DN13555_c0_g2_i1::g.111311::m.111311
MVVVSFVLDHPRHITSHTLERMEWDEDEHRGTREEGEEVDESASPGQGRSVGFRRQWKDLKRRRESAREEEASARGLVLACALLEFAFASAVLGSASLLPASFNIEAGLAGVAGAVAAVLGAKAAVQGGRRWMKLAAAAHIAALAVGTVYWTQIFAPAPRVLQCAEVSRDYGNAAALLADRAGATCAFGREDAPSFLFSSCGTVVAIGALCADAAQQRASRRRAAVGRAQLLYLSLQQHAQDAREAVSNAAPEAEVAPDEPLGLRELLPRTGQVFRAVTLFTSEWLPWATASIFAAPTSPSKVGEKIPLLVGDGSLPARKSPEEVPATPNPPLQRPESVARSTPTFADVEARSSNFESRASFGQSPLRRLRVSSRASDQPPSLLGRSRHSRGPSGVTLDSECSLRVLEEENRQLRALVAMEFAPEPAVLAVCVPTQPRWITCSSTGWRVGSMPVWNSCGVPQQCVYSAQGRWMITADLNSLSSGGGWARTAAVHEGVFPSAEQLWEVTTNGGRTWEIDARVRVWPVDPDSSSTPVAVPEPESDCPPGREHPAVGSSDELQVVAQGYLAEGVEPRSGLTTPHQKPPLSRKVRWRHSRRRRKAESQTSVPNVDVAIPVVPCPCNSPSSPRSLQAMTPQ